jgi:hypothetical protein
MANEKLTLLGRKFGTIGSALVIITALAFPGFASAGAYSYDGIVDPMEYANSFTTEWFNDHQQTGSQFPSGGGQTTTVFWTDTGSEFRMGLLAPLSVKNMIWGAYLSNATPPSAAWDEAVLYYQHWCSPSSGSAATDGSNCTHHSDGIDKFLEGIGSSDFKTMVDSEKVTIDGTNFSLINSKDGAVNITDGSYKTSLTQIFDNNGLGGLFPNCDSSSCDAVNTAMSFEFLWTTVATGAAFKDWLVNANNDLVFHMSPERGGPDIPSVPVPAAFWLFGTALIGFIGMSRRTNLS